MPRAKQTEDMPPDHAALGHWGSKEGLTGSQTAARKTDIARNSQTPISGAGKSWTALICQPSGVSIIM